MEPLVTNKRLHPKSFDFSFRVDKDGLVPAPMLVQGYVLSDNGTWVAQSGGGGGITDGDKGDITVSSSGSVWTIDSGVVTNSQLAVVPTSTFKGRTTAGTGAPEDLTVAQAKTLLGLTGTNSGDQVITLTGDVTGSGTGSFAATIAPRAVTFSKLQAISTQKLLGRTTAGSGDVEQLSVSAPLVVSAGALSWDSTADLDNNARTGVRKNSAGSVSKRRRLNFIEGSNITLTVADDSINEEVDITIASSSSGVSDGDYGDIVVSSSGTVWTIDSAYTAGLLSASTTSTQTGYFGDIKLKDDTSPSHYLTITDAENLTADHTLSLSVNNGDRALTLQADLTVTGTASISGTHSGTSSGTNTGDQTITLTGDVTGSGTGSFATTIANDAVTTAKIADDAVTFAKIQNITDARILGRSAGSNGDTQELQVGTGLLLSGGFLSCTVSNYTDEQAQDAVGSMVDTTLVYVDGTPLLTRAALTGDVTASQGSNATTIANDAVTFAKFQNITDNRLLGRSAGSTGDMQEISVGSGLSLSGGTISATGVTASAHQQIMARISISI